MKTGDSLKRGAAQLFGAAVKARKAGYDIGLLPVCQVAGMGVISVGNLRTGGSGKTPLAMFIAQRLRDAGVQTALLLRGYKGKLEKTGGLVSLGNGPIVDCQAAGDEATMAALRLKGVQVWVGQDRIASARNALAAGARMAVLDDGFQHRRLHRDLDILLTCPEDMNPQTKLLPAGPLRETMHAAGRADLTAGFADDWKDVEPYPKLLFEYVPSHLVQRGDAGSFSTTPLEPHRNLPVYLVSGIARPQRFEETVRDGGFNIVGKSVFEDHHRFSDKDNISIASKAKAWGAKIILTTEKDLVRMFRFTSDLPLFALRVDVKLASGPDILSDSLASLAT